VIDATAGGESRLFRFSEASEWSSVQGLGGEE
jgi:hypothetical protein